MDRNKIKLQRCVNDTVRLVRACGSKQKRLARFVGTEWGQARKSLWIETARNAGGYTGKYGQARKSLWIETLLNWGGKRGYMGQARKSLWIETSLPNP